MTLAKRRLPLKSNNFYYGNEPLSIREELAYSANSTVYKVNSPLHVKEKLAMRKARLDKSPLLPLYEDSPKAILKICTKDGTQESERDFVAEERTLLEIPRHENIVQCFGVVTEKSMKLGFLMEYCHGGNLQEYLVNNTFSLKRIHRIINEVLAPVIHLHKLNMIHRDIKSLNYLVTQDCIKLCDFGLCRENNEYNKNTTFRKLRTTLMWAAPELYDYDIDDSDDDSEAVRCTFKSDIYSVTIVIWEILNTLFCQKYSQPMRGNIYTIMNKVLGGERPNTKDIPIEWTVILEQGWDGSPENRPNINKLYSMVKSQIDL